MPRNVPTCIHASEHKQTPSGMVYECQCGFTDTELWVIEAHRMECWCNYYEERSEPEVGYVTCS